MAVGKKRFARGTSLAEVMVSVVVVGIAALGGLSYEYHSARHSRIARAQITATRTAQLLLEDWKSTGGSSDYSPAGLGLGFSPVEGATASCFETGTTPAGPVYSMRVDDFPMVMMLGFRDVEYDGNAGIRLRQLSVVIQFGEPSDGVVIARGDWLGSAVPIVLATYVRSDASAG